ncbi:protein RETICULATA-RELATED 3, chloroplastic-like isoform X2 [Tasmannia lanceolata]|uniref:protein RETICULATA-RELATED 3, chloroplastic-like isoform X2 n=1 Tax=Tasmannia lanceolata TaxID=3420 RepID=UPI0040638351
MAQLRYTPLSNPNFLTRNPNLPSQIPRFLSTPLNSYTLSLSLRASSNLTGIETLPAETDLAGGNGNNGIGHGYGGNGGNDGSDSDESSNGGDSNDGSPPLDFGILGFFINGWRSRVSADPQFPFKVLMEELVGVSSCVLGDMASRPNFGLNELDFVFSTLIVGSILNFVLMYLLAPTASLSSSTLPAIFSNCPKSHMFEPGAYGFFDRFGTFVYKGIVFAAVGFAAGLVGTAISNGLLKLRKKMDPNFESPNKAPPTILNALTWAVHMGLSSNFRYQTLNGVEFLLAKALPPLGFKTLVVVLRALNNVLGGVSFVMLARLTGSQKSVAIAAEAGSLEAEKVKLLEGNQDLQNSQSHCG